MANSKINIYYSADNRLYKQFLISLISLTENNKDNELHIINFDVEIPEYNKNGKKLNDSQISTVESIIKKYNKKNTFREINVSDLVRTHLLMSTSPNVQIPNKYYRFNAYLYIRLLFPFVKDMPKKII
jgi:lipopolysaccharide biosynthesis glycosyltransferase